MGDGKMGRRAGRESRPGMLVEGMAGEVTGKVVCEARDPYLF